MVRGNVHKVTEVFWPKKYCALKALSEMLFVLEEKFILLPLRINHFFLQFEFFSMGIKFRVFKFRDFFTIAKNAKLKTREIKYQ